MEIKIEKSLIKGKSANLLYGIVFTVTFLSVLVLDIRMANIIPADYCGKFDEYASWAALVLASAMWVVTYYISGRNCGRIDTLKAVFLKDKILLSVEDKSWEIPNSEIKEVTHNMVITRYAVGDSQFRLKIIRRGKTNLTFINPETDWGQKIRFE